MASPTIDTLLNTQLMHEHAIGDIIGLPEMLSPMQSDITTLKTYVPLINPVTQFLEEITGFGTAWRFTQVNPELLIGNRITGCKKVVLEIVSEDDTVSGNIVLAPVIDGVEGAPIVVPVGIAAAKVTLTLDISGNLIWRRLVDNAADTLKMVDPETDLTVVIGAVLLKHVYYLEV